MGVEAGALGAAIGGGTNLSGEWGTPIQSGFARAEGNEFRRMQMEQQREQRLQKKADDVIKMMTVDDTKWHNNKYGDEFKNFYAMQIAKGSELKPNDRLGMSKIKLETQMKLGALKQVDIDEHELGKNVRGSITQKRAQDIYSKEGFEGIAKYNESHSFAPIANIDPDSSHFTLIHAYDPKLNNVIDKKFHSALANNPDLKRVGTLDNGAPTYMVDMKGKTYQDRKSSLIYDLKNDPELLGNVFYSQEFVNKYDNYLKENNINPHDLNNEDQTLLATQVAGKLIDEKVDLWEKKSGVLKQGGSPRKESKPDKKAFNFTDDGGASQNGFNFTPVPKEEMATIFLPGKDIVKVFRPETNSTSPIPKEITVSEGPYKGRKIVPETIILAGNGKYFIQSTVEEKKGFGSFAKTTNKRIFAPVSESQLKSSFRGDYEFELEKLFGTSKATTPSVAAKGKAKIKRNAKKDYNL